MVAKTIIQRWLTAMCLILMSVSGIKAQEVQILVQAPSQGEVGRILRVSYVIKSNGTDMPQGQFSVGDFEGFVKRFGPAQNQGSEIRNINGRMSASFTISYTYTLEPTEQGTIKLPVATYTAGGKTIKSAQKSINILPASSSPDSGSSNGQSHGRGGNSGSGNSHQDNPTPSRTSKSNGRAFFIVPSLSKQRVYEQEAVVLTYKIYFNTDLSSLSNDEPRFDGMHVQEIDPNGQRYQTVEDYNGQRYSTVVWKRYLLFPQRTGRITIPEVKFEALTREIVASDDPMDYFFGGGSLVQSVRREMRAPAVSFMVDSLPSPRPAGFTGAVGNFSISSQVTPLSLKANEATTMRVTISGTGNLQLMRAPEVKWPRDFETYDPKSEEQTQLTANGVSGRILFDYIAVPRHEGQYDIEPFEFVYFDPSSRTYKTLSTEPVTLDVARGEGHQQSTQEDIEELGSDIRHIKTTTPHYIRDGKVLFGSVRYWIYYSVALIIFLIICVAFRRYAQSNADIAGKRGRKASQAANKRLHKARKLMSQKKAAEFYDETMRTLWGYVSDKLGLPQSELTKENVSEQLSGRGVDEAVVSAFLSSLDECEFARFAPGDPASTMDHVYGKAEEVINQMDRCLRKNKA